MTVPDITRDSLTGLLNRREFERHLKVALAAAYVRSTRHALCYLDLDRFKAVNDACGHDGGDQMLVGVAALIRDRVGNSGVVARLGGDEFGVLLMECPIETAREIADSVVREVADYRFTCNDNIFSIGVSIGLVELSNESGSLVDEMFAADWACSLAKEQGDHVRVSSAREEAAAPRSDERLKLQRMQAVLNYGPPELEARPVGLVDARNIDAPGLEVVLRLKDERGEAVAWRELLSAAETYRLIPRVDRWVVKSSLAALGRGEIDLPAGRRLVIHLSEQSLADEDFLQFVMDCFDQTGVTPHRICFEVTEDSLISNADCAHLFIGVLHGMGCRFGLGGVGRGLPSFDRLSKHRFDYLKFDGDLIRNLVSEGEERARVSAMIKLARLQGFRVVATKIDNPCSVSDVVAVTIDWELEGEIVLHLMVHADGSIRRQGDGTTSGASCNLDIGRSKQPLLRHVLEGLDPDLLTIGGVMALEPIAGHLCKLTVHFGRTDGGGSAFEVWYGSESTGPHPAIAAFVRNAIDQTNDWYQSLRPDPHGGN